AWWAAAVAGRPQPELGRGLAGHRRMGGRSRAGAAAGSGAAAGHPGHEAGAAAAWSRQEQGQQLRERLGNDPAAEWDVVRRELGKINRIRLRKLLEATDGRNAMSAVTTHVLDTARGVPSAGCEVCVVEGCDA